MKIKLKIFKILLEPALVVEDEEDVVNKVVEPKK